MDTHDLRRRAAWLRAVSARLPARDVAEQLELYAGEMEVEAEARERVEPDVLQALH